MNEPNKMYAHTSAGYSVGAIAKDEGLDPGATTYVDRLGPQFIHGLFSAGRTFRIHDINNRASQIMLNRLMQTLAELMANEGRVTARTSTDLFFLNEVRIDVDAQSADPVLWLIEEMKKRKVEEIDFAPELSAPELGSFLKILFLEPSEEDAFGELCRRIAESGVTNIRLTECIERETYLRDAKVERREIKEESKRAMSRAILFMGEVMKAIEHRRPVQLPKAHRLTEQLADIIQLDETILVGLASIKDYDEYTFSHSVNVSVLSMLTADRMGLSKNEAAQVGVAALFHDIGKTHVPQSILNKPGMFTADEWKTMERHTLLGAIELSRVRSLRAVLDPIFVSLQHHLSFSGGGYPKKPGRWEIHPYVHIIAIADVYDAITTPRVYRERTLTPDRALHFILRNAGKIFDPRVGKVFIRTMGVYPVGTVVELDTGENAVVIRQNESTRLMHRPTVSLLSASGAQEQPVDLAERAPDGNNYRRRIVRSVLDHGLEAQKAGCFISK
jgi:putative nucleotidyltransferase with HDIG domain